MQPSTPTKETGLKRNTVIGLLSAALFFSQEAHAAPERLKCEELSTVLMAMESAHYDRVNIAPHLERRTIDQYIDLLDGAKTLFLEKEVKEFRRNVNGIRRNIYKKNCDALEDAAELSVSRIDENAIWAQEILKPNFKVDESISIELEADKRGRPKTQKERRRLMEKLIHFQTLNQILSGNDVNVARERVLKRYQLAAQRVKSKREAVVLPELFADAFASGLDPHSDYLSAEALADFNISMRLSLEGIGAVLRSKDGHTQIQSIVTGGAADREGTLRAKDKITAVAQANQEPVNIIDMELSDVVKMIRGKKGTVVTLSVLREGKDAGSFDVSITRDKIDVKDQAAKMEFKTRKTASGNKKIAVITLPSFYRGSNGNSATADMRRLLNEANEAKADGLVLDLSENGGGLLDAAVRISGFFIQSGAIVATKSMDGTEKLRDRDRDTLFSKPMAVVISPASASASEILAAALQDYKRAVIVGGEHTFGKGSVQQIYPLPNSRGISGWDSKNGAMKVTMGMFFRPGGDSTQSNGVISDIRIPTLMDGLDFSEADLDHALTPQKIKPFASKTANAKENGNGYKSISPELLSDLSKKSSRRIASNKLLQQTLKDLKEEKDSGPTHLGRYRKKVESRPNFGDDDASEKEIEDQKGAFIDEAVNIVVDMTQ